MKFTRIRAPDFDLEKTLDSGQVFHWQKVGDGFAGAIGDVALYVEQRDEMLKVRFGGPPQPTREPRVLPGIRSI
jgi:8-oxoguanine DNA glycosylase, N-terminal domain